jgi:hypothetical protein
MMCKFRTYPDVFQKQLQLTAYKTPAVFIVSSLLNATHSNKTSDSN